MDNEKAGRVIGRDSLGNFVIQRDDSMALKMI